jgi:hypothetical protein
MKNIKWIGSSIYIMKNAMQIFKKLFPNKEFDEIFKSVLAITRFDKVTYHVVFSSAVTLKHSWIAKKWENTFVQLPWRGYTFDVCIQ